MDPFYVLGVPEDATDEEVEARYQALLRRHAPDRDPEGFRVLRRAYEALRTPRGRIEARLFYVDERGAALTEDFPRWCATTPRPRLSPAELAALLRGDAP
jgi:hypothetical protein